MSEEKRKTAGITVWLNELQFQKLQDVEEDFQTVFDRHLTHGEAVMAAALISKAFIALLELGSQALESHKLDFNSLINFEHLQKAGAHVESKMLTRIGSQIERVFIQLDTLGFLKPKSKNV